MSMTTYEMARVLEQLEESPEKIMFGKYQFLSRHRLPQSHTSRDESISNVIFMHTTYEIYCMCYFGNSYQTNFAEIDI